MNQETLNLHALGEVDPELYAKIVLDIEEVVFRYMQRNIQQIAASAISRETSNIERLALRALKTHLNNASNIY